MIFKPVIRKSAIFLGTKNGDVFTPRATAFMVRYDEQQHTFYHLVTAEHVVSGLLSKGHEIWLRANLSDGTVKESLLPSGGWHFYPQEEDELPSDVAVMPANPKNVDCMAIVLHGEKGVAAIPQSMIMEPSLGEEVAAIGLFRSHFGEQRNVPIVRIGHLVGLRDEPVWTKYTGYLDAYLVQLNSIAGLSGSPVFIFRPPKDDVDYILNRSRIYLLGLVHGHFDVRNLNEDVVVEDGDEARGINTGIGIVIPVEKIMKTIEQDSLKSMRQKVIENKTNASGATADLVGEDAAEQGGANPNHKEDFTRLLNAAVKGSPSKGQT